MGFHQNPWTPEEDKELLRLREQGYGYAEIAKMIGRPRRSCDSRYQRLIVPAPHQVYRHLDGTKRPCLKCKKLFKSHSNGNRICKDCEENNRGVYEPSYVAHI